MRLNPDIAVFGRQLARTAQLGIGAGRRKTRRDDRLNRTISAVFQQKMLGFIQTFSRRFAKEIRTVPVHVDLTDKRR